MNNYLKFTLLFLIFLELSPAYAKTSKVTYNQTNCQKVNNYGANDIQSIASYMQVSMTSVRWLGTKWGYDKYYLERCVSTFDTAKGPVTCGAYDLYTNDGGRTTFATHMGGGCFQ